jgi:hypothetical protein
MMLAIQTKWIGISVKYHGNPMALPITDGHAIIYKWKSRKTSRTSATSNRRPARPSAKLAIRIFGGREVVRAAAPTARSFHSQFQETLISKGGARAPVL